MTIDPELFKQLIDTFITELDEHAQTITNGLLALEKNKLSEVERNKYIEDIFRSAHNIKGTARSLGIENLGEIAHSVETIFSSIQKKNIPIQSDTIDLCLESVDKMRTTLQAFANNKPLPFNIDDLITRLKSGKNLQTKSEEKIPKKKEDETINTSKNPIKNKDRKSSSSHHDHESIRVSINKIDKLSSLLEEVQINKIAIDDHYIDLTNLISQLKTCLNTWKELSFAINNNIRVGNSDAFQKTYISFNDSLIKVSDSVQSMHKNIRNRTNELSILTHSLLDEVRTLRMISIGNLMCTLPRYVRDISHQLNKQVELTVKGDEVKIDKSVLEYIKDPIIHLIRNAIDHGIEPSEIRKINGKSEVGHIEIDIKEEGSQILINISDDGAGIDVNKISEIAVAKNILKKSELQTMNNQEILNLIFLPGFSTKEIITDVSGRGVGLDVVKSNVEDLKGKVDVMTHLGKKTTFTLTVPIAILSERGLLVKTCNEFIVIPTVSVERVLQINSDKILEIQGTQAILLDKNTIPLRLLADILSFENISTCQLSQIPIVVIKKAGQTVALIVDEIIGEKEIVSKSFPPPLSKVPYISGGTLLENNQVVIVLDPADIINAALQNNFTHRINTQNEKDISMDKTRILVVDDSITTRTLEKNVLENKNYDVTVAVNGKEAWDILQKQKFSLIITDIMMPVMDGFTLTENIKKSEVLRNIPVIIVTSLGSDEEKKRGVEVGADAYIVKNEFESGILLDIVKQLV